eukprot:Rhum_TRINITY_DN15368_c1_g2::Rhum_TRINITY_DN15368_c1_g2_i6::g.152897::m.152897
MEVMCRDGLLANPLPCAVAPDTTAAGLLRAVCELFGRAEEDMALEVDGVVVCVSGGGQDVEVSSLGLHADSSVVLCRSRERLWELLAQKRVNPRGLPAWVWDDAVAMVEVGRRYGIRNASERMRDTEAVVIASLSAVGLDPAGHAMRPLAYASERLQDTESVVLEAVSKSWGALLCASMRLKDTASVVITAVRHHADAFEYASERLQDDESVVVEAAKSGAAAFEFASARLRDKEPVVLAAAKSDADAVKYASARLWDSEHFVAEALKVRPFETFNLASERIRDTEAIAALAVKHSPSVLRYASDRLRDTEAFVLQAVRRHGSALEGASDRLRD